MDTILVTIDDYYDLTQKQMIANAGEIIADGGLVAFPTETVYGLGADALNEDAAAKIYEAKGRPSDNPLIVHICDFAQVDEIAYDISEPAREMMRRFWPGPLTVIFKKKSIVPDGTTGGLNTVAIRMPSHPVARYLIESSGKMIAAPSANTSGRPSPTLAEHVYEDLRGKIPMIIDGGPVSIGIESTIIDMSGDVPTILRPGFISQTQLAEVLGEVKIDPAILAKTMQKDIEAKAPGMKYRHYAPKAKMILVEGESEKVIEKINELAGKDMEAGNKVGIIATDETRFRYRDGVVLRSIGKRANPDTVSHNLFALLREFDEAGVDVLYSESFFEEGLGDAIMNRMLKASGYQLVEV